MLPIARRSKAGIKYVLAFSSIVSLLPAAMELKATQGGFGLCPQPPDPVARHEYIEPPSMPPSTTTASASAGPLLRMVKRTVAGLPGTNDFPGWAWISRFACGGLALILSSNPLGCRLLDCAVLGTRTASIEAAT